ALKYQATYAQGVRNGSYQAWYPRGALWYRGRDDQGVPQDSVIYGYPNGTIASISIFRDGAQVHFQAFDSITPDSAAPPPQKAWDSVESNSQLLSEWSQRVRLLVESRWRLPRKLRQRPDQAVARIEIGRDGKPRSITWLVKSRSSEFNAQAAKALK